MLARLLRIGRNFYVATGLGLLIWMLFFDTNDLISQARNAWKLRDLKAEKAYYQQKVKEIQGQRQTIIGSLRLQEKYARENYLMRKPGEDVYVLVDENNEPIEK